MAKIYQQDTYAHTQPPVVELPNYMLLNGQPYDKTNLVPIPFKEINLSAGYEQYMVGRVAWLKSNTSDGGRAPLGNIYFTRGTPDIVNPDVLVDNIDSNTVYILPCIGNFDTNQTQPIHKLTMNPLARVDGNSWDLDSLGGSRGMFFIGQDDDWIFVAGASGRASDYGYQRYGRVDKASLSFSNTGGSTRQSKLAYVCQDVNYYYLLHQTTYLTTTFTRLIRVDKATNVETVLSTINHDNTAYDGWYHAAQALELEADKKSAYWAQVITDAGLAFKWYRAEVDLTGGAGSQTLCTTDYSAGGGQSSVVVKPTQTGEGITNLESWAIEGTTNYICMLPTEHDQYSSESLATFRLYVYAIDAGDKNNLIFKNYIDTDVRAWGVFQVQDDWKKIAIVHNAGLKFYTWNAGTETYDVVQDLAYGIESVMRDANDRIWIRTSDGSVHMISATSPTRVEVTMENATYNYQGSNIATYANVSAYDIDNARIVANVQIVLEGSIYFTDNSQNKTITTSASGETQVDMVIKGSSYTRILASVVV